MSRVFLAEEVALGRKVVIKVLPPDMAAGVNEERFRREIQLAARSQYPHIVPLLSAGAAGDLLYFVMPFGDGESLRVKLAREGELGELYESRSDREKAVLYHGRFVDLWRNADAELQPLVRDVRRHMVELAGEPRR